MLRGKTPTPNVCSGPDTKQSDGEVPVCSGHDTKQSDGEVPVCSGHDTKQSDGEVPVCSGHDTKQSDGEVPVCSGHDTKQSDGEVPVKLKLWGMQYTLSLPSLPCPLWLRVVATDKALSMGQIELNSVFMLNGIA